ncbi:hypothetical protein VIGAN_11039900 [Vigna angularis var. angularis]|uniref:Uncharacterized protein n=1 Tax=Vigna angularis var. angularis TaxID=157739 RepID=A0A0S3T7E2_PHAAN|nr:hypothetical protein VIGAN_11039900 [Vigna angularis var. angularis]
MAFNIVKTGKRAQQLQDQSSGTSPSFGEYEQQQLEQLEKSKRPRQPGATKTHRKISTPKHFGAHRGAECHLAKTTRGALGLDESFFRIKLLHEDEAAASPPEVSSEPLTPARAPMRNRASEHISKIAPLEITPLCGSDPVQKHA